MNAISVLKDSFLLVKKEPKVFVPKLVTTALYSFHTIWAASLALRVSQITETMEPDAMLLNEVFLLFGFMIALYFIDLLSYAMYPSIVSAHNSNKPVKLLASLLDAMKSWKTIIVFGFMLLMLLFTITTTAILIQLFIMESAIPSLAWITAPITVALILAVSILFFFVMPIAILEKKGIIASISESISLGLKHKNELLKINLTLMVLAFATMLAGFLFESTGFMAFLALAGFIAIRLLQAMLYTYVYVVNPYFYLKIKEV